MRFRNNQQGFTLIEVLVAMVVLTIGVLSLYSMQISSIDGNAKASRITTASTWAGDRIEQLLNLPYDDIQLRDTDLDGAGQDNDNDGIDDDENNDGVIDANERFGLYHDTVATADGSAVSPDGAYTILWNVAENQLTDNLKTIRIIVQFADKGIQNSVTMDYVKARK